MDRKEWNLLVLAAAGGEPFQPVQLQKALFLLSRKIPPSFLGPDFYHFEPYNFGPFDVGAGGYYGQGQILDMVGLRFKQFPRWAWNVEAALHHKLTSVGETRVFAEFDLDSQDFLGSLELLGDRPGGDGTLRSDELWVDGAEL